MAILEIRGLAVDFKGFRAIDGVDMDVERGELRVIIGPNGAGKSTLMDLITAKTRPTAGSVTFDGADITGLDISDISARRGIGRKFQGPNIFGAMTALENVELALNGHNTLIKALFYRRTRQTLEQIDAALARVGLYEKRGLPAGALSHGEKQWLEICMLLAQNPKLMILDEPTTGMTAEETYKTGELIMGMSGEHTIIVAEHDMDFVRQVASTVTVLHQGRVLAEGGIADVERDPRVVAVYLKDSDSAEDGQESVKGASGA
ncbi:MAG: urea ABC transporter ATP-binding protein UrtD [Oscillospiraceae bacterium]|jgi:urea transport system ATP-binding protein|nr:urea ABC transporter ATP-binding protein UrtD [Oscillospiraceae bacterium]